MKMARHKIIRSWVGQISVGLAIFFYVYLYLGIGNLFFGMYSNELCNCVMELVVMR